MSVLGVVLAGGASRRMGATDKVLVELAGRTLLARAIDRLGPQVDRVVVNGPVGLADHCDREIVPDTIAGRAGPLAGVLAALDASTEEDAVVTAAVDTPFFPRDLAPRLTGDGVGIARADDQLQPVFGYWPRSVRDRLAAFLASGDRKIMLLADQLGYRAVDFSEPDAFFNINEPDDLARAVALEANR